MPRFRTLKLDEAEKRIHDTAGGEPIIVDGLLVALKVGPLRFAPSSSGKSLVVTEEQAE